jgi:hypothetical protein
MKRTLTILTVLLALAAAAPSQAGLTAKQAFRAKVKVVATTYATNHHWKVTDMTVAASVLSIPGQAPTGYGSAVVGMQGGGTIAAVSYSGKLKKVNGAWVVSAIKLVAKSTVS